MCGFLLWLYTVRDLSPKSTDRSFGVRLKSKCSGNYCNVYVRNSKLINRLYITSFTIVLCNYNIQIYIKIIKNKHILKYKSIWSNSNFIAVLYFIFLKISNYHAVRIVAHRIQRCIILGVLLHNIIGNIIRTDD